MNRSLIRIVSLLLIPSLVFGEVENVALPFQAKTITFDLAVFTRQAMVGRARQFTHERELDPKSQSSEQMAAEAAVYRQAGTRDKKLTLIEFMGHDIHFIGGMERWASSLLKQIVGRIPVNLHFVYGTHAIPEADVNIPFLENTEAHEHPVSTPSSTKFYSHYPITAWRFYRAAGRVIRQELALGHSIILQVHTPYFLPMMLAVRLLEFRYSTPVILTFHQVAIAINRNSIIHSAADEIIPLLAMGTIVTGVSEAAVRKLFGTRALVGSFVDTTFFSPALGHGDAFRKKYQTHGVSQTALLLFDPSRIVPDKGQEDFIVLASRLKHENLHAQIVIMGPSNDDDFLNRLKAEIKRRQLDEVICFLPSGSREDMRDGYAASSIVISPTRTEALGLIFLEAAAMKCPVVSYAVEGVPEAVQEGVTGFLAPARDAAALSDLAIKLLKDPELRERMGQAGRHWVITKFSINAFVDKWISLLANLSLGQMVWPILLITSLALGSAVPLEAFQTAPIDPTSQLVQHALVPLLTYYGGFGGFLGALAGVGTAIWRDKHRINPWGIRFKSEKDKFRNELISFGLLGFALGGTLGLLAAGAALSVAVLNMALNSDGWDSSRGNAIREEIQASVKHFKYPESVEGLIHLAWRSPLACGLVLFHMRKELFAVNPINREAAWKVLSTILGTQPGMMAQADGIEILSSTALMRQLSDWVALFSRSDSEVLLSVRHRNHMTHLSKGQIVDRSLYLMRQIVDLLPSSRQMEVIGVLTGLKSRLEEYEEHYPVYTEVDKLLSTATEKLNTASPLNERQLQIEEGRRLKALDESVDPDDPSAGSNSGSTMGMDFGIESLLSRLLSANLWKRSLRYLREQEQNPRAIVPMTKSQELDAVLGMIVFLTGAVTMSLPGILWRLDSFNAGALFLMGGVALGMGLRLLARAESLNDGHTQGGASSFVQDDETPVGLLQSLRRLNIGTPSLTRYPIDPRIREWRAIARKMGINLSQSQVAKQQALFNQLAENVRLDIRERRLPTDTDVVTEVAMRLEETVGEADSAIHLSDNHPPLTMGMDFVIGNLISRLLSAIFRNPAPAVTSGPFRGVFYQFDGSAVSRGWAGEGVYLYSSFSEATKIANQRAKEFNASQAVIPLDVILENPKRYPDRNQAIKEIKAMSGSMDERKQAFKDSLLAQGYDSLLIERSDGIREVVAFFPERQIKFHSSDDEELIAALGTPVAKPPDSEITYFYAGLYRVVRLIHTALDGEKVYEGRDLNGRPVLVKEVSDRHEEEVLKHLAGLPRFPRLIRYVQPGYLILEYIEGKTLKELIEKQSGRFADPTQALGMMEQVGRALHDAHEKGVIHKDLKPGNIMVSADDPERITLIDFGLAVMKDGEQKVGGTFGFLSPEQLENGPVTAKSDVYAMGLVMFRVLVGQDLFAISGNEPVNRRLEKMRGGLTAEMLEKLPSALRKAGIDSLFQRALAFNPSDRPTAAEFADQIKRVRAAIEPERDFFELLQDEASWRDTPAVHLRASKTGEEFRLVPQRRYGLKIVMNDQVMGDVELIPDPDELDLSWIYVSAKYEGRGIPDAVIAWLSREASERHWRVHAATIDSPIIHALRRHFDKIEIQDQGDYRAVTVAESDALIAQGKAIAQTLGLEYRLNWRAYPKPAAADASSSASAVSPPKIRSDAAPGSSFLPSNRKPNSNRREYWKRVEDPFLRTPSRRHPGFGHDDPEDVPAGTPAISDAEARELIAGENLKMRQFISDMSKEPIPQPVFENLPLGHIARLEPGKILLDLSKISSADDLRSAWRDQIRRWILELHNQRFLSAIEEMVPYEMIPSALEIDTLARGLIRFAFSPREKVLELGVGYGHLAIALQELGAQVVAVDISTRLLKIARTHFRTSLRTPLNIAATDSVRLSFKEGSFDRVFSRQTLTGNAPWSRPDAFAEIYRVLKPGGRFVLYEFIRQENDATDYSWEWTPAEWAEEVKRAGFKVENIQLDQDTMVIIHATKPDIRVSATHPSAQENVTFFYAGPYRVVRLIHTALDGEKVYEGRDLNGRPVLVKEVSDRHEEEVLKRLAGLPRFPRLIRYVQPGYLILEYIEGKTLKDWIENQPGRFSDPTLALGMMEQVGRALSDAHEKGVIHKDIKPGNIMLSANDPERITLIDFGYAALDAEAQKAGGTFGFMPPEQLDNGPVTAKSDVYAMGLVMYRVLAGQDPFAISGNEPVNQRLEKMHGGLTEEMLDKVPSALRKAGIDSVLHRAMAFDPADRPTAAELANQIRRVREAAGHTVSTEQFVQNLMETGRGVLSTPEGDLFEFEYHSQNDSRHGTRFRVRIMQGDQFVGFADVGNLNQSDGVMEYGFLPLPNQSDQSSKFRVGPGAALEVLADYSATYRGIGRTLMGLSLRIARRLGWREFYALHVSPPAIGFYRSLSGAEEFVDEYWTAFRWFSSSSLPEITIRRVNPNPNAEAPAALNEPKPKSLGAAARNGDEFIKKIGEEESSAAAESTSAVVSWEEVADSLRKSGNSESMIESVRKKYGHRKWQRKKISVRKVLRDWQKEWGFDDEVVAEDMQGSTAQQYALLPTPFPPILVVIVNKRYAVEDGEHRLLAAYRKGDATIDAYVGGAASLLKIGSDAAPELNEDSRAAHDPKTKEKPRHHPTIGGRGRSTSKRTKLDLTAASEINTVDEAMALLGNHIQKDKFGFVKDILFLFHEGYGDSRSETLVSLTPHINQAMDRQMHMFLDFLLLRLEPADLPGQPAREFQSVRLTQPKFPEPRSKPEQVIYKILDHPFPIRIQHFIEDVQDVASTLSIPEKARIVRKIMGSRNDHRNLLKTANGVQDVLGNCLVLLQAGRTVALVEGMLEKGTQRIHKLLYDVIAISELVAQLYNVEPLPRGKTGAFEAWLKRLAADEDAPAAPKKLIFQETINIDVSKAKKYEDLLREKRGKTGIVFRKMYQQLSSLSLRPGSFDQISRAFDHMTDNAFDAIAGSRSRKGKIRLAIFIDGTELVLEVEDNGIGIPAEVLAKLIDELLVTTKHDDGRTLGRAAHGVNFIKSLTDLNQIEIDTKYFRAAQAQKKIFMRDSPSRIISSDRSGQGTLWRIVIPEDSWIVKPPAAPDGDSTTGQNNIAYLMARILGLRGLGAIVFGSLGLLFIELPLLYFLGTHAQFGPTVSMTLAGAPIEVAWQTALSILGFITAFTGLHTWLESKDPRGPPRYPAPQFFLRWSAFLPYLIFSIPGYPFGFLAPIVHLLYDGGLMYAPLQRRRSLLKSLPEDIEVREDYLEEKAAGNWPLLPKEEAAIRQISEVLQHRVHYQQPITSDIESEALTFGIYGPSPLKRLFVALRHLNVLRPGMRVLDLGSGLGAFAIPVAKVFQMRVDGMEIHEERFKRSLVAKDAVEKSHYLRKGAIHFYHQNFLDADIWQDYDVYYYFALGGSANISQLAQLAIENMKPGAMLIVAGIEDVGHSHYEFDSFLIDLLMSDFFEFRRVPGLGVWVFTKLPGSSSIAASNKGIDVKSWIPWIGMATITTFLRWFGVSGPELSMAVPVFLFNKRGSQPAVPTHRNPLLRAA